jgi:tRNA (mo5U34)-methyltransferase
MSLFIDWQLENLCSQVAAMTALQPWANQFPALIDTHLNAKRCSEFHTWQRALQQVKFKSVQQLDLTADAIRIGQTSDLTNEQHATLLTQLKALHPWRKGPFEIFGHHIDCEWRSDWKWSRLAPHISNLNDKLVLDVGCGNGYFGWRMLGAGARLVIGIDPTPLFNWQWQLMRQWIVQAKTQTSQDRHLMLPLTMEQLPEKLAAFDSVFSMGVLYHRRSPLDHLQQLKHALKTGGELVLETLVIDGPEGMSLLPAERYAQMRNVWFVPTVATLKLWLVRLGFKNIRSVNISTTTTDEQRSTPWMQFDSLKDFLDPTDLNKTIEGYPAPKRALLLANRH